MIFATPPLAIIDLPADARHTSGTRSLSRIEFIVIHSTEGTDSRTWLSTDPNSDTSAHFLIQRTPYNPTTKKGGTYKIAPITTICNHAGYGTIGNYGPGKNPNMNTVSNGIELERYGTQGYTDYQMTMCAKIILEWYGLLGYIPIISHKQIDPTRRSDPVGFDWTLLYRLIDQERVKLVQPVNVPPEFKDHLRAASTAQQTALASLVAMVASLEGF